MDKYLNRYRIPSARMQGYDYGQNGAYFITICTQNREHYFGSVVNQTMHLNELGVLADKYWHEIPLHFPFVELGGCVVMPNHVHGILLVDKPGACDGNAANTDEAYEQMSHISPRAGSVSAVIRSYKSAVSKHARNIHAAFAWQARFHDHIIRNDVSYDCIMHYILTNPQSWETDTMFV